jgi:FixJ family two-component response regulator
MKTTLKMALIDDEPSFLEILQFFLETHYGDKVDIKIFDSATLFLEDKTPFDIVLCDHLMPEMSGIDVAKRMCYPQKDIKKMVIMTGYNNIPAELIAPSLIDLVVDKPFNFSILYKFFDGVLSES